MHINFARSLLATASFVALALPTAALAQETSDEEIIVVTGTRGAGRSQLSTPSPVDVLSGEALRQQGTTELGESLSAVAPSIDFPRPAVVDGTDSIRPATLRGLSPDQTLVLVNGTRRHASALVNVNGSVGRGSAAVDLNAIPVAALDRVEVLRDGASAQYGSDAIAGVVNLRLREAREGGGATISYGQYDTSVEPARSSRDATDGQTTTISGWQGFALGSEGFLTVSAEFLRRDPTSRGDFDPNLLPAQIVNSRFGDPEVEQWSVYANAGAPLANGWEAYGWLGYQDRDSTSAAFPRRFNNANNVPAIYPDGFLPLINVASQDVTAAGGVRGELGGWDTDVSLVYGQNALDFRTENSLNSTYGAASQTSFDAGGLTYSQTVLGVDFARGIDAGLAEPINFAWGFEARREIYEIEAGEPASYDRGPAATPSLASGAQGFIGFQPGNEIDEDRTAWGAYVDVEVFPVERLLIGAAVRYEDYSDFGETLNGKLTARYDFTDNFALRGAVSSGFRAPSLQQSYFTSTASVFQAPDVVETGTFPATSLVARTLGAEPLKPEEAVNYSIGAVFQLGDFDLTIDAYRIEISDQIVLSENISRTFSPQVAALLDPLGVSAARFFINGVETETQGLDIVGRYQLDAGAAGDFDFVAAVNFNDVDVTRVPTSLSVLSPTPTLLGRNRILTIEEGTPGEKAVVSVDWALNNIGATARATYYGDVLQPGGSPAADFRTGEHTLLDLEGRYRFTPNVAIALGVDNVFDEYPDAVPAALNTSGVVAFPFYSPFGFNGRFTYARLSIDW
ncbi:MAG: TonB-dependent receptor [Alphaproteobacteria bacterium]|nr:MAG: TonB-dependent receptor [Alphaproteobacteria bacterium]